MHIFDIPGAEPPVRKSVYGVELVVPGNGELSMAMQPRLPSRFPVGTRYIVEGEPAKGGKLRIVSRYLVMPSGMRYDLMNTAEPMRAPATVRKPRLRSAQRRVG